MTTHLYQAPRQTPYLDTLAEMERECVKIIGTLRAEYMRAAEPYVKHLAELHSLRPPPPVYINVDNPHLAEIVKLLRLEEKEDGNGSNSATPRR